MIDIIVRGKHFDSLTENDLSLNEMKSQLIMWVKTKTKGMEDFGFAFAGSTFSTSAEMRSDYQALLLMKDNLTYPFKIRTNEGLFQFDNAAAVIGMFGTLFSQIFSNRLAEQQIITAIEEAETFDDLKAIDDNR